MKVTCPCGAAQSEPSFIGLTTRADEYGTETKFAWFSPCGHYVFLVVRAPFVTHGYGGSYEITHTLSSSTIDR